MAAVFRAEIDYVGRDALQKLAPESYAALRLAMPLTELPEEQAKVAGYGSWSSEQLMDTEDIATLLSYGIQVSIKRVKGVATKLPVIKAADPEKVFENLFQVHVANVGIMEIKSLSLEEDACTDSIQRMLNNGWRIVCVCPPNNTRRPTYIMGHNEEDKRP